MAGFAAAGPKKLGNRMPKWLSKLFGGPDSTLQPAVRTLDTDFPPLREFVYLDDVSLRSLLASQQGALPDQVKEMLSDSSEGELSASFGASIPVVPVVKTEISSRYSVNSSSGSETSKQHVVQSLFKVFRDLSNIHLILEPLRLQVAPSTAENVIESASGAVGESQIRRGELIEVEVELAAERIYRFSSIISELTDMATDYPAMLTSAPGAAAVMREAGPINRALQRMLVGLIPIRARATNLVVLNYQGDRYIVDKAAAVRLNLEVTPLDVVGVTEQTKYWKDTRRVLFGGGRFTMLCRVYRDGLHDNWRPVKLTNVLEEIAPQFADAIDAVGRTQYATSNPVADGTISVLDAFVAEVVRRSTETDEVALRSIGLGVIQRAPQNGADYGKLNDLMIAIQAALEEEGGVSLDASVWREMRALARGAGSAPVLPDSAAIESLNVVSAGMDEEDGVVLDTEIIAIYW